VVGKVSAVGGLGTNMRLARRPMKLGMTGYGHSQVG